MKIFSEKLGPKGQLTAKAAMKFIIVTRLRAAPSY
jgi:hypothetical protein